MSFYLEKNLLHSLQAHEILSSKGGLQGLSEARNLITEAMTKSSSLDQLSALTLGLADLEKSQKQWKQVVIVYEQAIAPESPLVTDPKVWESFANFRRYGSTYSVFDFLPTHVAGRGRKRR